MLDVEGITQAAATLFVLKFFIRYNAGRSLQRNRPRFDDANFAYFNNSAPVNVAGSVEALVVVVEVDVVVFFSWALAEMAGSDRYTDTIKIGSIFPIVAEI